jgi:hypothetical protein
MAHGKLFPRKTKSVKEWTISSLQMKQLSKEAPKEITKQKIKSPELNNQRITIYSEKFS